MDNKTLKHIQTVWENSDLLHDKNAVERAFDTMAADITAKLADTNPVCLSVMNGGIIPTGHLLTRLAFPLQLDSVHATRYRNSTQGQTLTWKKYPDISLANRTVLIIDDILDAGLTARAVVDYCKTQQAAHIYTAMMIKKIGTRSPEGLAKADFTGLSVPNRYVFGYGLDYHGYLRNALGIYAVKD